MATGTVRNEGALQLRGNEETRGRNERREPQLRPMFTLHLPAAPGETAEEQGRQGNKRAK
jgi:hypothetical protein